MKCKYCQKSAGLFSSKHKECEQIHSASIEKIKKYCLDNLLKAAVVEYNSLHNNLQEVISLGYIDNAEFDTIIVGVTIDVLRKRPIGEYAPTLKDFICSLPSVLKDQICNTIEFKEFWGDFFCQKFSMSNIDGDMDDWQILMSDIKINASISAHIDKQLVSVLEQKILEYLSDGIVSYEQEHNLSTLIERASFTDSTILQKSPVYQKLIQSLILRDIKEGKTLERLNIEGLPILLGSKEELLWVFRNVRGYEEKTGRRYTGGSQGVSLRLCKGVYYRVGANKGHSVEYQYQNDLGAGVFILTNKNIYFIGGKQVKMSISKVLSFEAYRDGIMLVKDGATPKPYTFVGFDPWFVINAMQLVVD